MHAHDLTDGDIDRWRALIVATGAADYIEDLIAERVSAAVEHITDPRIDQTVQGALAGMAAVCTMRVT